MDTERLGCLQVNHQLELGRLLHRQIGRLIALKDASGIAARQPVQFREAAAVADETAGCGELASLVDRRQGMFQGKRSELLGAAVEKWISADGKPARAQLSQTGKRRLELLISAGIDGVIGPAFLWIAEDFGCCASG